MFNFSESVFENSVLKIPETAKIIFVSDMFLSDYVGGAELTTQALIDSSPLETFKLHSRDVSLQLLQQNADKFWIFGNFAELNPQLMPSIIGNLRYSILEYDYKYCKVRSPEKHLEVTKLHCDCHNQINGKIISAFFYGSMHIWWMSDKQRERYMTMFPFLIERDNTTLSSVFDETTLGLIKSLRDSVDPQNKRGWIVLGSDSWIKGAKTAEKWCLDNNNDYEIVWNIPYSELLKKLASAEGLVYLPSGGDTCPRLVIEAKLLGCKLQINEHVQHADEEWFATDDLQSIEDYLFTSRKTFWSGIKVAMNYKPTISGYTTTYNCVSQEYPFEQSIKSMLEFCDEVCVVDGGSTDGTLDILKKIQDESCDYGFGTEVFRLKIKVIKRDWNDPHSAVFDGAQKAEARLMCQKEYCWQMDSDEVVHEDDAKKISEMCRSIPKDIDILSLPVIEYWGGSDKVRLDINPVKWRVSRNKPHITHGIPVDLRRFDENGALYAAEGTDGCDLINKETFERLHHVSFYTQDIENVRRVASLGNEQARQQYEQWFNMAVNGLPSVFHYSWHNLERKIKLYQKFWSRHWLSLYNKNIDDTAENNMMFDVPWSEVTDEMIKLKAEEFKQIGGWIWHSKYKGQKTPWITCKRTEPAIMTK